MNDERKEILAHIEELLEKLSPVKRQNAIFFIEGMAASASLDK